MQNRYSSDIDMLRMSSSQELLLDIVRLCMAQFIVVNHLLGLLELKSGAGLGGLRVTVFFMLSGFLIFATTWRRQLGPYTFTDYMIDRSARLGVCLVPALSFSALIASHTMAMPDYPAGHAAGPVQFVGNLLMLEDYPAFQILRRLGIDSEFFIRPYAAAEPYWTLPIEFWLYVVFGFMFFFVYLQRGRPGPWAWGLMALAFPAVVYFAATGYGNCLTLVWILGCVGPWLVSADHRIQQHYRLSEGHTLALIWGWVGLCLALLVLRGMSRTLNFYEFQTVLFLAGLLMGLIWLTGRCNIDRVPLVTAGVRWLAKQSYALYLTHNAVLTLYIAYTGSDMDLAEGVSLIVMCNAVAVPFYLLFDRHHKTVAQWLKALPALRRRTPGSGLKPPGSPTS